MVPGALRDLARAREFRVSLVVGAVLAGATLFALVDRRPRRVVAIGGLLIALGFAIGLAVSSNLPLNVAIGTGLLAIGGFAAGRSRGHAFAAPVFAVPGALVLAMHLGTLRPAWVAPLTALVIVVASPLVADFDRRFAATGWPLALYAITVVGMYFTVPDTERALVLLGVAIPFVFLGWPVAFASLGSGGAYAALGALMWTAAFESRGREASLVGAIGCLGLFVAEPLARALPQRSDSLLDAVPRRTWSLGVVGAMQLGLVYIASRIAGLRTSVTEAVLIVTVELMLSVVALRASHARGAPTHRRTHSKEFDVAQREAELRDRRRRPRTE